MGFFNDLMNHRYGLSDVPLKAQVDCAINLFEQGNISELQQKLFEIYSGINKPGGGMQIVKFGQKDRLGEIFTMCLRFDWMHDRHIREVWAENGFYCLATYLASNARNIQDLIAGALDMFLLIHYGKQSLLPKINNILNKASYRAKDSICIESRIFDSNDFNNGGEYLLRHKPKARCIC